MPPSDAPGDAGLRQAALLRPALSTSRKCAPNRREVRTAQEVHRQCLVPAVSVPFCAWLRGPHGAAAVPPACCTGTAQARAWRAPRRGCDSHRVARRWNRRSSTAGLWHQHCAAGRWDPRRDAAPHPSQFSPAHSPQTLRHLWSLKHPLSFPPRRPRLTHFPEPHALSFSIRTCLSLWNGGKMHTP